MRPVKTCMTLRLFELHPELPIIYHRKRVPMFFAARVGKTSLSTKFVHGQFDKQQSSTVDASFLEKVVQVGEKRAKLAIWDTAGQEKYHALAKNYYQGASGKHS